MHYLLTRFDLHQTRKHDEQDYPSTNNNSNENHIIKKENYNIWEHENADNISTQYHNLWDLIVEWRSPEEGSQQQEIQSCPPAPKTENTTDCQNGIRKEVYEDEMKRSLSSTSNSQNLVFLSFENTSSTNEVSTASGNFEVNTARGTNSSSQVSSTPGADEVSQVECYNCHRKGHFAKECKSGWNQGKRSYGDNSGRNATTNEPSSQALVAQDGLGGYDWSNDIDELVNYALIAISSSSSSSSSNNK
ncbi:ribonuclease H-like domain-containing protein, partial [Tanacetum coccineum]